MDVDPVESATGADEDNATSRDRERIRLNTWVAVTVALLATFLGICKIKDDNIVQAMQQAQADKLDHWNFYQARNIRQDVAQAAADQLIARAATPAESVRVAPVVARYQAVVADQKIKKDSLRVQASDDQKRYDALNYRDDQFDLSDALTAIAISLLALTSLTQKRWLFWIAIVATILGVTMGTAALAGWKLHPDAVAQLLS
jgi:hypothetical protein